MNDISSELTPPQPNIEKTSNVKNVDKSVKARLKSGARNVLLAGLVLTPGIIHDTKVSVPNIKNPTPAVAPSPDFKSQSTDTLQPYTPPEPPAEIPSISGTAIKEQPANIELRFKAVGMETFLPFYIQASGIINKYRADLTYFDVINVSNAVAKGEIVNRDNPRLIEIRDGWGSEKEIAIEKALEHVNNITIKVEGFESYVEKADEPEEVREKLLRPFARSFAPLARTLPNELVVNPTDAFSGHDILMITSLNTETGLNAALPVF